MKPYFETELGKLYNCDCMDLMRELPDKCIDLVLTSPPYNLGNNHHTGIININPYDDDLPEIEYQEQQAYILDSMFDKLKDNGSVLYNHKNRIKEGKMITPYSWILNTKFIIKQELVWFNRSQNFDKCRFYPMTERIYWLSKNTETFFFNKINKHDLFTWEAEGTNKEHARSYPVKMCNQMIECFGKAEVIFDPFMGSGTTAVACEQLGRRWIGCEISEKYCEIAKQRIMKEHNQVKMNF